MSQFSIKAIFVFALATFGSMACASEPTTTINLAQPGPGQVATTGSGLQSLLGELAKLGIDPNRLSTIDANGQIVTPFTPGVTVQWQHISSVQSGAGGVTTYSVANGQGSPGDIEIDTVRTGTTITVFTWQYQKLSNGSYGWVAIGVVSYTIQSGTEQK